MEYLKTDRTHFSREKGPKRTQNGPKIRLFNVSWKIFSLVFPENNLKWMLMLLLIFHYSSHIFCFSHLSGIWNTLKTLKISKCYIKYYANVNLLLYFFHFNNAITKHWNISCTARGGWVGFHCFLTLFKSPFKYLQNIAIPRFPLVKLPSEKYNMLREDEDGRMLFLYNEFLLYIFCYIM